MRSMRRGIREMDLILKNFADQRLKVLSSAGLDLYEALLEENDHDIYAWISGAAPAPENFRQMIDEIAETAKGVTRPDQDVP